VHQDNDAHVSSQRGFRDTRAPHPWRARHPLRPARVSRRARRGGDAAV